MTDEAGSDSATEIATIEQTMRTDYPTYQRNPVMQARYGELLTAREAAPAPAREPTAVDTEIAEIEALIKTDNRAYRGDPAKQARYLELLGEQQREGSTPLKHSPAAPESTGPARDFETALGNPVEVLKDYREAGADLTADVLARGGELGAATNILAINLAALNVAHDIGDEDGASLFLESFNRLPDRAQAQTFAALLTPAYDQTEATSAELKTFVDVDAAGETLVAEWGENAAYRLGVVKARTAKIFAGLSADEKREVEHFISSAPEAEWTAILRQLGNPDALQNRPAFKKLKNLKKVA